MEDEIVELVISMDDPQPSLTFVWQMRTIPRNHLVEERDFARLHTGFDVNGSGLRDRNPRKRLDLPRKVGRRGPEGGETEGFGVQ